MGVRTHRESRATGLRGAVRALLAACLVALLGAPAAAGAVAGFDDDALPPSTGVIRIRLDDALDVGTLSLLRRAAAAARERNDRLVVELDTPGGAVDLMWQYARAIERERDTGLLVVAWVHDDALSAGALVAMACDRVYASRTASIGSSMPVTIGPGGVQPIAPDPAVVEKQLSALRGQFRAWAEANGRPPLLAEAMVDAEVEVRLVRRDGAPVLMSGTEWDDAQERGEEVQLIRTVTSRGQLLNLTGPEAVELGLADALADDESELMAKLGLPGARPVTMERTRSEDLASLLHTITPLLLLAGLFFAWTEIKTPGFGVPGALAILCFAILLFGRYLVGLADFLHVALIVVGAGLLAAELFLVPGTLWLGIAGGAAIVGGLMLSALGPSWGLEYELDRQLAFDAAFQTAVWATLGVVAALVLSRLLPRVPGVARWFPDPEGAALPAGAGVGDLVGERRSRAHEGALGVALTDLRPVGKVRLDEGGAVEFEATASGPSLDRGARVRVLEHRVGRLVVEAAPASSGGEGSAP